MGPVTETMSMPMITAEIPVQDDDAEAVDWRDLV